LKNRFIFGVVGAWESGSVLSKDWAGHEPSR
jgi:hypothetical protein